MPSIVKKYFWLATLSVVVFVPKVMMALGGTPPPAGGGTRPPSTTLPNPVEADSLVEFLDKILDIVTKVAAPIIVLAIIYSGFLFVKARGNEKELETAKTAFTWTIVGAAILIGARVLSAVVQGTINSLS